MQTDLRKEQQEALARPRLDYSLLARFFFLTMDLLTGKKTTLAKAKLIEMLAGIPYRAWELRQVARSTRRCRDGASDDRAREIIAWSRAAQDNEHWHLRVLHEKMIEDGCSDPWYLSAPCHLPALRFLRPVFAAAGPDRPAPGVPVQRRIRGPCRARLRAIRPGAPRMGSNKRCAMSRSGRTPTCRPGPMCSGASGSMNAGI